MTDKEFDYMILQKENENLLKANKDLVREIDALGEENKRLKALFAEYIKPIDKFIKDRENKAVKDCEKVKEIKKALETCMHTRVSSCRECPYNYTNTKTKHSECFRMAEHALTLINVLENENEILKINMHETENLSFQINQMNGNLILENQTLKNRIAELEDKIEDGTLIELPCKVGDIVYQFDNGGEIYELMILHINIYKGKPYYETDAIDFDNRAIGESIFLTKAEAESKFKELQEGKQ